MRHVSFGLIIGMFLAMFGPAGFAQETGANMSEGWWKDRFAEKQTELHSKPVQIIFLGDSILHSFEWSEPDPIWNHWYGDRGTVNLGFNGDGVNNVIWRIEHGELDGISPKLAVILIGTNDMWMPPHDLVTRISVLVQSIRHRSPTTRILVLSILPSGRPEAELRKAQAVNAGLATLYGKPGSAARYEDVSCVFLRHGTLNTSLFRERQVPGVSLPLHPTLHGMDLLAARIEPVVASTLGDAPRTTPGYPQETDCKAR